MPQAIIRFFRFNDTQVHYFERKSKGSCIEPRNPTSVFWRKNLYTLEKKCGERDRSIEDLFAVEYDDKIGPLIRSRVVLSRTEFRAPLSRSHRELLCSVALNLLCRSPVVHEYLYSGPLMGLATSVLQLADELSPRSDFTLPSQVRRLIMSERSDELAREFIQPFGIHFCVPLDDHREFVLGELPLVRFIPTIEQWTTNPYGKSERQAEFVIPIAPQLAIVFSGSRDSDTPIRLTGDLVDKINLQSFVQSQSVVARSRSEIDLCIRGSS